MPTTSLCSCQIEHFLRMWYKNLNECDKALCPGSILYFFYLRIIDQVCTKGRQTKAGSTWVLSVGNLRNLHSHLFILREIDTQLSNFVFLITNEIIELMCRFSQDGANNPILKQGYLKHQNICHWSNSNL